METTVAKGKPDGKNPEKLPSHSVEERRSFIAASAYDKWEDRGCLPGNETTDWLAAEAEFDKQKQSR